MTTYSFQPLPPYGDYLHSYFAKFGGDIAVLGRVAAQFAVSEASPPGMTVSVAAGAAWRTGAIIELPARMSSTIEAPSDNPRIDRIVLDGATNGLVVVQGTEAAMALAPAIPDGCLPLARIDLTPAMMAITNAVITDERLNGVGTASGNALLNVQTFTSNGIYTPTPGTSKVIVRVIGGGSGGSCSSTSSSQGSAATGGGAGAYAEALLVSGFAGVTVTVGAGGLPAAAGNNRGIAGGASRFGNVVIAPGGTPGNGSLALVPPFLFG